MVEQYTIEAFAEKLGVSCDDFINKLFEYGIKVDTTDIFDDRIKMKLYMHHKKSSSSTTSATSTKLNLTKPKAEKDKPKAGGKLTLSTLKSSSSSSSKASGVIKRRRGDVNHKNFEEEVNLIIVNLFAKEKEEPVVEEVKVVEEVEKVEVTPAAPVTEEVKKEPETKPEPKTTRPKERAKSFTNAPAPKKTSEDEQKSKRHAAPKRGTDNSRGRFKSLQNVSINDSDLDGGFGGDRAVRHRKRKRVQIDKQEFTKPVEKIVKTIQLPKMIVVSELANQMSVKSSQVIKILMSLGVMANINQAIDRDAAVLVVEELGHKSELINENALEDSLVAVSEDVGPQESRPPVVTVMGHVDHGKTSLLDYIRKSTVATGEAGGITQHIGAYHVETDKGTATFLDTPGHEAFTAMRQRGTKCTDIVILVVAADDGVKPQTLEAIQHAKAAEVPMIVAVNKMDKPDADPERIKTELSHHEVISEEWGGDTIFVNISAKTGDGIDKLIESILLQADVLELKAVSKGNASGTVIESRLDKSRGPIATILVQQGELKKGDIVLAGQVYGRIRAMIDEHGRSTEIVGPSMPVEILGLNATPNSGDSVIVVPSEKKAREAALYRESKLKEEQHANKTSVSLENLFEQAHKQDVIKLNIVVKADVQGSIEAILESLTKLSDEHVSINIVSHGVGAISHSDAQLALVSNAIIVGFNVRPDVAARSFINKNSIDVHYYSVIYDLMDEIRAAMTGLMGPQYKEVIVGLAEVRDTFRSPKLGTIAGCMVIDGSVKRNNPIRVLRDNIVIYEGVLESLRRFKDDASEVRSGTECGIGVKNYNDVKVGDQIEVFENVQVEYTPPPSSRPE